MPHRWLPPKETSQFWSNSLKCRPSVSSNDRLRLKIKNKKSSPVVAGPELRAQQHSSLLLTQEKVMATHIKRCWYLISSLNVEPSCHSAKRTHRFVRCKTNGVCLCTPNTNKPLCLLNFDKCWTSWWPQTAVSFEKPQSYYAMTSFFEK